MASRATREEERDRTGLEDTTNWLGTFLGRFVPQWLARRAIAVAVTTDATRYETGDPVEITVKFRNRLPVPVVVSTPERRLWGWSVDGVLEASDEPRRESTAAGVFAFRARETKTARWTWRGRFKRTGDPGGGEPTRWELADPGEHEIRAFVAVDGRRPEAETTVRFV